MRLIVALAPLLVAASPYGEPLTSFAIGQRAARDLTGSGITIAAPAATVQRFGLEVPYGPNTSIGVLAAWSSGEEERSAIEEIDGTLVTTTETTHSIFAGMGLRGRWWLPLAGDWTFFTEVEALIGPFAINSGGVRLAGDGLAGVSYEWNDWLGMSLSFGYGGDVGIQTIDIVPNTSTLTSHSAIGFLTLHSGYL